jgi:Ca-activated chloride channel family protein
VSAWLAHLHWREPLWLVLAAVPWLAMVWRKRRPPHDRLTDFADPHLLRRLLSGAAQRPGHSVSLFVAWVLAAVAAAGPYWQPLHPKQARQRGADIAVIVDISPSMAAADVTPTRLARAKRELHDFTKLLDNDRVGLVAFSANAYSMVPLTTDYDAFLRFVDLLDPGLTALPGSNLTRALEVAEQLLKASAERSRAVVLLSDGEFHDPKTLQAARRLGNEHIPLFVIGMGTEAGGPVPDSGGHFIQYRGQTVISHLDRDGLRTLARAGRGAYFDLHDDDSEWRTLLTRLHERTRAATHTASHPLLQGVTLYPWLLGASLLLFLWNGARRREAVAMFVLTLLTPLLFIWPTPGDAAPWSEQRAYEALQQGYYGRAQTLYGEVDGYDGRMGEGAAAYRLRDWQTALAAFQRAAQGAGDDGQKARALYNAGNALAQLHRFREASNSYRAALRLQPKLSKAALNLSLVNQFLDAQRGEQQRKDAKQSLLSVPGPAAADAEQLDRRRRGEDRSASSDSTDAGREDSPQRRAGTQSGQGASETSPRPNHDERLQQTLALWRGAADHGSGSPELESLRDNSADFLRRLFRQDDYGPHVKIIKGKPW